MLLALASLILANKRDMTIIVEVLDIKIIMSLNYNQQLYNRNQNNYQNNVYNNDQNRSSPTNYQLLQPWDQRNDLYRNSDSEANDNINDNRNINNRRSRDNNANNNNMNQKLQASQDKYDDQLKKRFRTYIAEIISEQRLPNETTMRSPRLQIEGVPLQHQYGLMIYNNIPMEEEIDIYVQVCI